MDVTTPRIGGAFILLSLALAAPIVVSGATYELGVSDAVDTPQRTVSIEGTDYTVSSIGHVNAGGSVDVSVSAPSSADYDVLLYNSDREIAMYAEGTGDASLQLDTDTLEPGSYMLALDADGVIEKVQPLVIEAYDTSLSLPADAEPGDTVNASVSLSSTGSTEPIDSVQVILMNDSWNRRVDATETGENQYRASLALDVEPGTYRAFAVVRGTDTANGEKELIGVSDAESIEISDATTTTTESNTTTTTGGNTTTSTTTTTEGNTTEPNETTTTVSGTTATTTADSGGTAPPSDESTTRTVSTTTPSTTVRTTTTRPTTTASSTTTTAPSTTESNVITPSGRETTANGGAPFPIALSILTLLAGTLLWDRTR